MKKISFLIPAITNGGSERIFLEIGNFLANNNKKEYSVEFFFNGSINSQNYLLHQQIKTFSHYNISYKKYFFQLIKYFNFSRPSIVFTSLYTIGFIALFARMFSFHKPKIVLGAHNALSYKIKYPDNTKDKYFLKYLSKFFINKADLIVSVSNGVGNELIEKYNLKKNKVINIYGPTLNKHKLDQYLRQKVHHKFFNCKSHKVIICVGRLSPQKGYDVIIKSFYYFQKIYKSKLIIIGEGSEEKKLKELCRSLNLLEHVDFIGSQSNPYKYIVRSDMYVAASRWEGLSLSIIDSLYSGTNVVASDCQYGPSEILENGRYGILTKVNSEKNLLNGMLKSIKISKLPYSKFKNKLRGKFFVNLNVKIQYLNIVNKFLKTKC